MAELRLFSPIDPHAQLERLRSQGLNFDPAELLRPRAGSTHWIVDRYSVCLPPEPPGEPLEGSSWAIGRALTADYEFVDPSTIRAFYHPAAQLEGRTMLLEVRVWGFRIYVGVRAGGGHEEYRTEQGRRARVWAWNYRTLAGHFERGQIDYEVWKWLDSGEVEFRLEALSRAADPSQFLVALGFRLIGRQKQVEFARKACERMARLTRMALEGNLDVEPLPPLGPLAVRPDPRRVVAPINQ
jgi:hypothetical protein